MYIDITISYYIFVYNLIILIYLNLQKQLFNKIINSIYNTRQNLNNNKRYIVS